MIDHRLRVLHQVTILYRTHDSYDLRRLAGLQPEERIDEELADRVAFRKEGLGESLVDRRDPRRIGAVLRGEKAALLQRNPHGRKVSWRGVTLLYIGYRGRSGPLPAGNLKIAAMAAPAKRQAVHRAGGNHAR